MKLLILILGYFTIFIDTGFADNEQFTCPMHPHYISERDGSCPICGMDLVGLVQEDNASSVSLSLPEKNEILYWQAPMDPSYRSDKPGKSPMGMDLVPVYSNKSSETDSIVKIESGVIQNMGVLSEPAEMAIFGTQIKSYGNVSVNERQQYDISNRVSGWVEELNVNAIGDYVSKGALLYKLYSPDLVAAQQDYLAALKSGVYGRVDSSRKKLRSLGVQSQTINAIKESNKYIDQVPFYSEVNGVISDLKIKQGSYIKSGMTVAQIQDYSNVWIHVSIAEKDLQYLSENMVAEVSFPNLSNKIRDARIDYIYPTVDEKTRTGLVRLVLDNPGGDLRPGAYADITFDRQTIKQLSIPSDAVLKSSQGNYVVLSLGDGRFQPRKIQVGSLSKGRVHVLSGLSEGDSVVVRGQFMIDSESSLRGSFLKMKLMEIPIDKLEVNDMQLAMMDQLINAALYMHESIVDGFDISAKMFDAALKSAEQLKLEFINTKLKYILENAIQALNAAHESITERETQTALAKLVRALEPWILEGNPKYYREKGINMFTSVETGDSWMQMDSASLNPYGKGDVELVSWPSIQTKK